MIDALKHPRWRQPALFGGLILLGLIWIVVSRRTATPQPSTPGGSTGAPAPVVGAPAPDFELPTPDGSRLRLSDLRGKAVLVNFWATWCSPCRAEMPTMQAVYDQNKAAGFVIVGVNMRESATAINGFMQELGLAFPTVIDDGSVARTYQVINIPASFFIDANGIIRARYLGPMSRSVMQASLDAVLPATP